MKVSEVMTSPVATVEAGATLKDVAVKLGEHRISGLPVVDEAGRVLGVVSEGDILYKEGATGERRGLLAALLARSAGEAEHKAGAHTAGEAMSAPAITISPGRTVAEAASLMLEQGVNRLPVTDADGSLVGIVTRADLVRAFVRSDEEIAREIREDVVARTVWNAAGLQLSVENGDVTLSGQLETRAEAEVLPIVVRRVPGVVSVLSTLTWERDHDRPEWTPPGRALPVV